MKMITAIIQPDKSDAVREALIAADIKRITVSRVAGHGRQIDEDLYRGQVVAPNLIPKVRFDIACNDEFVAIACQAIIKTAKTGKVGDGKIFISPIDDRIRISDEEHGGGAI